MSWLARSPGQRWRPPLGAGPGEEWPRAPASVAQDTRYVLARRSPGALVTPYRSDVTSVTPLH